MNFNLHASYQSLVANRLAKQSRSKLNKFKQLAIPLATMLLVLPCLVCGQDTLPKVGLTQLPKENRVLTAYQTSVAGWTIHPGDTLQLGRGSLSSKSFAFVYRNDTTSAPVKILPLGDQYAGRKLILIQFVTGNTPAADSTTYGIISTGQTPYYYVALANAINKGELLPPIQYRPSAQASPALPVRQAEALLKLQSLLKAGTISQAEYNQRSKKLLNRKRP